MFGRPEGGGARVYVPPVVVLAAVLIVPSAAFGYLFQHVVFYGPSYSEQLVSGVWGLNQLYASSPQTQWGVASVSDAVRAIVPRVAALVDAGGRLAPAALALGVR